MHENVYQALKDIAAGKSLSVEQAESFMNLLMQGHVSPIQTAGLLTGMAVRGETVSEIVGFARGMRHNSLHLSGVPHNTVDTCGTGGDGLNTFNISTASAIVAAGAGAKVAKHGNRAASSRSGSADVLQALGARVDLTAKGAEACLADTNLCFMFAQYFHPAMKHAAETRKQLGFRTIFNILGPLTNPAGAKRQLLGVFRRDLVKVMAEALLSLGGHHVMVVHGHGGLDEISISGETLVAEVKDGKIHEYTLHPSRFNLPTTDIDSVVGGDASENADMIRAIMAGERGPRRDIVLLNAGAVLYVGGVASSVEEGVRLAELTIDSGRAEQTLVRFIEATHRNGSVEGNE